MHRKTIRRRRPLWLFAGVCASAVTGLGPANGQEPANPAAPAADQVPAQEIRRPEFLIVPSLTLQETYTDNPELLPGSGSSEFITRGSLGLSAQLNRGRATGALDAQVSYDRYAKDVRLSGWSLAADGSGTYWLLRDRLSIEALGTITNSYTSSFAASAVDRSGAPGRTQLSVFYIGPKLTTTLGRFADLTAAARYGRVSYQAADASVVGPLPGDDNIYQARVALDTGERRHTTRLLTTAEVTGDDRGYSFAGGAQSVYVRVAPAFWLIGRGGYEHTRLPGSINIDAPLLSAGFEFRPNKDSRLTVEGGERYKHTAWAASADVRLTGRTFLLGRYAESLSPDQLYVADAFTEFFTEAQLRPPPTTPRFHFDENLYDQASRNKRAELTLTHDAPSQTMALSALWSDRHFLLSNTRDRYALAALDITRHARPDLDLGARAELTRTYESPVYGRNKAYALDAHLAYRLNSTTDLSAAYRYKHGRVENGGSQLNENAAYVAVSKRF